MNLHNIWGQGQIFAFSALDGRSLISDDFVGVLSGDKIGIRFFSKTVRELALVGFGQIKPTFKVVTADLISLEDENGEDVADIIYTDTHLIIGKNADGISPIALIEGANDITRADNCEIHDTLDGEFSVLAKDGGKFAFAFAHSKEEAVALAKRGLTLDIVAEKEKKLTFYKKAKKPTKPEYEKLYYKCISLMKTQLYSPEGNFKRIWSTPDRLPHKFLWLWDSVFHAIGFRNLNGSLAEDLILAIFDNQWANGFISHLATVDWLSDITQPPVIAWGAYQVYQKTGNKAFLKTVFENNKKFLLWCKENRKDRDEELYTWFTGEDVHCRCDESGMDNSPRFDTRHRLQAIDYSCFMANDVRFMQKIAEVLDMQDEANFFSDWYEKIKADINAALWCDEDKFYYDFDMQTEKHHKIQSVASFLPLFAGICSSEQADALVSHLKNPETFYTNFPIPSISKKDATFGSDMWRGPVWINYNYMIIDGLRENGFEDFAKEIETKTITTLKFWYEKSGVMFEFYDCENKRAPFELNRKGAPFVPYNFNVRFQAIRDYGWSTTLLFDLLCRDMNL